MASDSLCSWGSGFYFTKTKKLFRLSSGGIIGTAGDDDCRSLLGLLDVCETEHDLPTRQDIALQHTNFMGLLVLPNNTVFVVDSGVNPYIITGDPWDASISQSTERYVATGHGMDYALSVLHSGGTVQQAVKIACKFSLFCKGPIQTLKLETIPKAKKLKGVVPVVAEPETESE